MGALFSRVKTWVSTEDVNYSDLNAEFDNILTYLTPAYVDDYSANVSQMQTVADPGEVGSESLATSLAGEITRLRKLILEITGEDKWYESPVSSLLGLANAIGTGLTDNRVVSGKVRSSGTNEQPIFLNANGAARTVAVKGTTTNFIYYVAGTEYTISTDVTLTGLTAAPTTNNTCLVNDALATGGQIWTKWTGEDGSEIPVDTMGTEITALVGKFAAFKLTGAATEYFLAYVKSSTALTKAYRGYFFDSSDAPVKRTTYTNNDTITLMKLTWIFAKTDGTLTATYTNPVWSKDEPTSPALGDYWFDLSTNRWKVYGVGSYAAAGATLVGVCIQDGTNTVAARSFEFFANYDALNTSEIIYESATQVKVRHPGTVTNVWGETIRNDANIRTWDITLDLDSGVTEASSTPYYFYLTQVGDVVISDVKPFDRTGDLQGYYHPHSSWRCLGSAFNNSGSSLEQVNSYHKTFGMNNFRILTASDIVQSYDKVISLTGASYSLYIPSAASMPGGELLFVHNGTSISQVYTIDGYLTETIGGSTTYPLYTNGETLRIVSDGTNWVVLSHYADTEWTDAGATTITAITSDPTKGNSPTYDKFYWRRRGRNIEGHINFKNSTAVGSAAGTGDYLFKIVPTGATVDTTVIQADATASYGAAAWNALNSIGYGTTGAPTAAAGHLVAMLYDTTRARLVVTNASSGGGVGSAQFNITTADRSYSFTYTVPITGWKP